MTRILAVDWDLREARCVLASATREKVAILLAASIPLVDVAEGGGDSHPDVSGSLRAALADRRVGRGATVVGVNRASVELMNFTLPPAKDPELAQLVLNQALRESQTLDEAAALDFFPMSDNPREPRPVTAAVLSPEQRERIEETCAGAGLKPTRIVLRPLAAASLFARTASPADRACLLVHRVADEADLTVLAEGRVAFLRTVRLPEDAGEAVAAQRLSAEITRTLVVAQQGPLGGGTVERVFVYAGPDENQALLDQLSADLSIPVSSLDPFEGMEAAGVELPGNPGRFASLLGMVLDEAHGAHAIDFLHPRRPPRPPNWRRHLLAAAAAVALLGCTGGYLYRDALKEEDANNAALSDELKQCREALTRQAGQRDLARAIRQWDASEVVWLDELRDLSRRFPPSRDAMILRMTLGPGRSGAANVEFSGLVRDSAIIDQLVRNLSDPSWRVRVKRVGMQPQGRDYAWGFEASIELVPREKELYRDSPEGKP
jgi:hypothetical protein